MNPIVKEFYSHIVMLHEDGCWNFDKIGSQGYGYLYIKGRQYRAHRLAWRIFQGSWPTKCVLHRCDDRSCVRPDHLFEGTKGDNNRDTAQKGRTSKGEEHWNSKLNSSKVREIKELKGTTTQQKIALKFGVDRITISKIHLGRIWRDIV